MNFNTTIVLIALVLVVGAYFYFIERNLPSEADQPQITASTSGEPVFGTRVLEADWIDRVEIERRGERIVLAQEGGDWWQVEPVRFPLNTWTAGREFADAAAALRYTARSMPDQGNFPSLGEMELAPPAATVTLHGSRSTDAGVKPVTHTLKLGRTVGSRGYLMIDDRREVYFTDKRLHDLALRSKVNDWRRMTVSLPREPAARRVALHAEGDVIELVKREGDWSFEPPHDGRVSRDAVRALLEGTAAINIESFIADQPEDLSVFGLDAPLAQLSIFTPKQNADVEPDGEASTAPSMAVNTIAIGRPTDLSEERFYATMLEDGKPTGVVFAVRKNDRNKLATTLDRLRDPRIVTASPTDVRQLKIERHDGTSIAMDRGSAGWTFAEPGPGFTADHDAVAKLVTQVAQARAERFIAGAAPAGEPLAMLTLSAIAKPEPEVLRIFAHGEGDAVQHLVLRNGETTGHVLATELLAPLFEPVAALRNRSVLGLTADRLTSLTLTRPDGAVYRFERTAPADPANATADQEGEAAANAPQRAWKLVGHAGYEEHAFQQLLAALLPLRATRWVETEPTQAIGYTLELTTSDDTAHRIDIDPATRIARAEDADQPFEISTELLQRLGEELRDRTVISYSSEAIASVVLARGDEKLTINQEGARYVDAAGDAVDQSAAAGLFDALGGMRAERYLPPLPDEPPRDGLRTITITTREGATLTLLLDAAEGRACVDGGDAWFLLDQETIAKLVAPLPGDDFADGNDDRHDSNDVE